MKKIITNNNKLKEEDITEVVKRVKILLINSKNEILLAYSHNHYIFIGGHVEKDESLIQTINREITEETGIELNIKKIKPFACNLGYYKDWPSKEKNRKIEIYYYKINTDENINLNNISYTENEKEGKFELKYIPLENIENELIKNREKYGDEEGIIKEMLEIFKIYKENML